jgi:hypothetical protein
MKGFLKLFGIIAILTVVALTFTGCGGKDGYVKVINQHERPIVGIHTGWDQFECNIETGQSETFLISGDKSGNASGLNTFEIYHLNSAGTSSIRLVIEKDYTSGKTTTITFGADGVLK